MKQTLSVIICTRNAESTLSDCIFSVKKNKPAEIILIDGNSTDNTVRIAEK